MKNILFVSGEGLPFIKSGGLADVIGSLPDALTKQGLGAAVVLPMYKKIIEKHPELEEVASVWPAQLSSWRLVSSRTRWRMAAV